MDASKGDHVKPQKALEQQNTTRIEFLCVKPEKGYKPRYHQKPKKVKFQDPTPPGNMKAKFKVKAFNNLTEMINEIKEQGIKLKDEPYDSRKDLEETKMEIEANEKYQKALVAA